MKNINSPAFPTEVSWRNEGEMFDKQRGNTSSIERGLSKLELAAIKAMQGILASYNGVEWLDAEKVAEKSVVYANALLAELEKQNTKIA